MVATAVSPGPGDCAQSVNDTVWDDDVPSVAGLTELSTAPLMAAVVVPRAKINQLAVLAFLPPR